MGAESPAVGAAAALAAAGLDGPWPSLRAAALDILRSECPFDKARRTAAAGAQWAAGELPVAAAADCGRLPVPDAPARPLEARVVSKYKAKTGSLRAMLHGVCHAESYAIDLMWDSVARFAEGDGEGGGAPPRDFFEEWVGIATDEARHFRGWAEHLEQRHKTRYGELPTHDMLWEVAAATRHSLRARLAVVHLIHEARGLDVAPSMRARCVRAQDLGGAQMLDANIRDEVRHVAAGARWFRRLCEASGEADAASEFLRLARAHYYGALKRPFNTALRSAAGLPESWYLPLAEPCPPEEAGAQSGGAEAPGGTEAGER